MVEVPALSDADRVLICSKETRALRARVTPFVNSYRPTILASLTSDRAPSYVIAAIKQTIDAFDRWATDEESLIERGDTL